MISLGVMVACAVMQGFAASFADYNERISKARSDVESLLLYLDENDADFERETIAAIARDIPPTEKVDFAGSTVETNNEWLVTRLKDLSAEKDRKGRGQILTEILERLAAISESVVALEAAIESPPTKDADKQKLAEILRREEYQKPQATEPGLLQTWINKVLEWLARAFPRPSVDPGVSEGLGSLSFVLQVFIYAIVIGLLAFLLYKFAPFVFERIGWANRTRKGDRVILGERISGNESAASLFGEAEALARAGDLRGAIRKGYIALLCDLSDRKMLRLGRHKTNRDYLRDVRKHSTLFENMNGLTLTFERNWYGLKTTEPADWDEFRRRYEHTLAAAKGGMQ